MKSLRALIEEKGTTLLEYVPQSDDDIKKWNDEYYKSMRQKKYAYQ